MPNDLDRLSLTDAIDGLCRQIMEAAKKAQGLEPGASRFRITGVEMELTVVAEDSTTAGAEAGWWVFKAKADLAAIGCRSRSAPDAYLNPSTRFMLS